MVYLSSKGPVLSVLLCDCPSKFDTFFIGYLERKVLAEFFQIVQEMK